MITIAEQSNKPFCDNTPPTVIHRSLLFTPQPTDIHQFLSNQHRHRHGHSVIALRAWRSRASNHHKTSFCARCHRRDILRNPMHHRAIANQSTMRAISTRNLGSHLEKRTRYRPSSFYKNLGKDQAISGYRRRPSMVRGMGAV